MARVGYAEDSGLAQYMSKVITYKRPSDSAKATRDELILGNLGLAIKIAKACSWSTDELIENIQYANEGLCKAADNWDPERGTFESYASFRMREVIRNNRQDNLGRKLRDRSDHTSMVQINPSTSNDGNKEEDLDGRSFILETLKSEPKLSLSEQITLEQLSKVITEKQLRNLELKLMGHTFEEIADINGSTHQAAQDSIRKATRTIGKLYE